MNKIERKVLVARLTVVAAQRSGDEAASAAALAVLQGFYGFAVADPAGPRTTAQLHV